MIDPSRLSALESYRPDDDTPGSAKVSIPAGDLRDLVALIPVVRAAMAAETTEDTKDFMLHMLRALVAFRERTQ